MSPLFLVLLFVGASGYETTEMETDLDYDNEEKNKTVIVRYDPHMTLDLRNDDQVRDALSQIFSGRRLNFIKPQNFAHYLIPNYNQSMIKLNETLTMLQQLASDAAVLRFTPLPQNIFENAINNITNLVRMFTQFDDDDQFTDAIRMGTNKIYMETITHTRKYAEQLTPTRTHAKQLTPTNKHVELLLTPTRIWIYHFDMDKLTPSRKYEEYLTPTRKYAWYRHRFSKNIDYSKLWVSSTL